MEQIIPRVSTRHKQKPLLPTWLQDKRRDGAPEGQLLLAPAFRDTIQDGIPALRASLRYSETF